MMVWLISTSAVLFSCGEPEDVGPNGGTTNPDKVVADPEGTIILSMRDFDNGNIRIDDKIYINKENWTGEGCSFVSVGEMKGLGNIESIPTTGWANQMGIYPNNGYVAYNRANDAYYRIFVTEYLYNTSVEIIGAKVKYQKPFCGRDEALKTETKTLSFTAEGGTEKVFFKNSSLIPFSVSNSQSWCKVQRISSSDNAFLYDGISVTTLASGLPAMPSDTITLETLYGKTHTIVVQREGHAYLEASAESLDFTAYSGSSTLMLKTNMKWEAYASDSWIELSPTSGDGNSYVKASVTANDSGKSRTGTVKFIADGKSASVAISQAGGSLSVSPSSFEIRESGETKSLKLATPSTWTATASDTWLKTTPESGSGDATLTLIVEANNTTATRTGTITFTSVDCTETVVVTQAGGSLSVYPSTLSFGDVGDTKSLKIQASNELLAWTAGTDDAWLKLSPDSGNGNATLIVTAEANNSAAERKGTITITSGDTSIPVAVTQAGGSFSVSTTTLSFIDAGETKPLSITTSTSLPWTATTSMSWLTISPESGNGASTISVTAEPNNSTAERTGKLFVISGDKSIPVVVTQSGGSISVSSSILSFVNAGETKFLNLQASNSMLAWNAITNDSWIKVSPESGSGSATLSITAEFNNSTKERSGKLTIVSGDVAVPITITQEGGSVSVSPSSLDFIDRGETKSVKITTPFTWTATSSGFWLKLSSTSGNGDATLTVTAEANNSTENRNGTLTIVSSDKTISVSVYQEGGTISVSPTSIPMVSENGGSFPIEITTSTPFAWTATVSTSWLALSSTSGNGSSTISVTVRPNDTFWGRTGNVTITSGRRTVTVSVSQSGAISNDWVDLGLPSGIQWATKNVGAVSPEDYGNYYAWGEIETKETYNWENYKWGKGTATSMTKYNTNKNYGTVDNKIISLELSDDVAYQTSNQMHIPTLKEWEELITYCTFEWTVNNGVRGYKVTSKINNNYIFIPAAGYFGGKNCILMGSSGLYWSSSLNTEAPNMARGMCFTSGETRYFTDNRSYGCSIRPVFKP